MAKTVFQGTRRLRDEATGEIIETQFVERSVEPGDSGFHKLWLGQILDLIEEVGNAKMQVLRWMLSQADAHNQIRGGIRDIAAGSGVSLGTVNTLLAALRAANVVTRDGRYGLWRLNPDVIFQGRHASRMNVLIQYREEKKRSPAKPETDSQQLRLVA